MLAKIFQKYIDLIKRLDPREDDEVVVKRFSRFADILQPGEEILWQGKPSARHAWGDHEQLAPAGSVGDRPGTIRGRKTEMILALLFVLFMFLLGAVFFSSGVTEIRQTQNLGALAPGIFLLLTGMTFMSGLPFLLRPFTNCLRARQLTYLLTRSRAMIVRRGHAWAEIWVRSPVIISVSLLFIYGTLMFTGLFIESTYQEVLDGAGPSTWLARAFILTLMLPLGFIIAAFGYIGLRFQGEIIFAAFKGRQSIFVRSFDFGDISRHDFPLVTRLREDGVGDLILGQDGHWEYYGDSNMPPDFRINAVGFLSVPEAKQVAEKVERTIAAKPPEREIQSA